MSIPEFLRGLKGGDESKEKETEQSYEATPNQEDYSLKLLMITSSVSAM